MGLLNFLPKEEQYFDLFLQMTVYISDAARELKEMLLTRARTIQSMRSELKAWNTPATN